MRPLISLTCFPLSVPTRLRSFLLVFIPLSWLLLLLSALSRTGQGEALGGAWPPWLPLAAQAAFTSSIFAYPRFLGQPLRGQNFLGAMRRLVLGPTLLALAGAGLYGLARLGHSRGLPVGAGPLTGLFTLAMGLFFYFLARLHYTWRALMLFKSEARLRRRWLWFELLLALVLLLLLAAPPLPYGLLFGALVGLVGFGLYLSTNQKWMAHLDPQQKWQALSYEFIVVLTLLAFGFFFLFDRDDPSGLVGPVAQQQFLLLTTLTAGVFAVAGLLLTFFNLPTAGVFEQRRAEILSLQRLTQVIQRGQTAPAIYLALLDSALQTTGADAGWLDVLPRTDGGGGLPAPPTDGYLHELTAGPAQALRQQLQAQGLLEEDFLSDNLPASGILAGLALPYRSVVVLPLRTETQRYATLYLLKNEPHGFEPEDLSMLQAFISQTLLSLENLQLTALSLQNQRVQNELRIAAHVQESLIPKKLPTDDWFEISSHALAAKEVGGDFYDLLLLPGKRLAVLIGDVSGKGVTAAFHMAQMKGIFHSLMQPNPLAKTDRTQYPVPSQFMTQANTALTHCLEKSSFITASLFLIDYENGGFMFARAGHCHTLYYSSNQEKVEYFRSTGLGLGIIRGSGYERHINNQFYDYAPGDVMVMYTDGIVEARGAGAGGTDEYGEDRLMLRLEESYYRTAEEIKTFIIDDLDGFTAGQPMHDDQTLLVIKFKAAQPAGQA